MSNLVQFPKGTDHHTSASEVNSNPFPWFRIITTAKDCVAAIQLSSTERVDIPIDKTSALDLIAELAAHYRRRE